MYSVDYLIAQNIMDANFPYPNAFCSCFNLGVIIGGTIIFFVLAWIVIYIVRWIFRLF